MAVRAHGQKTYFGLAWRQHEAEEAKKRKSANGGDKKSEYADKKSDPEMFPGPIKGDYNPWELKNLALE